MKATIKNHCLTIDLNDLFDSLPDEDRNEFIKCTVFHEPLINAIVDTVVAGSAFDDCWYIGGMADRLREKLLPLMPEIVSELLSRTLAEQSRLKSSNDQYHRALFMAYMHWPANVKSPERDYTCDGERTTFNQAAIDAWLGKKLPAGEWEAIKAKFAAMKPEVEIEL